MTLTDEKEAKASWLLDSWDYSKVIGTQQFVPDKILKKWLQY
jgi:hypothetical protein